MTDLGPLPDLFEGRVECLNKFYAEAGTPVVVPHGGFLKLDRGLGFGAADRFIAQSAAEAGAIAPLPTADRWIRRS
ncbi:MAG: hypothetical protein AMXMBFR57_12910 [Acidimicrobiia bacterium]